MSQAEQTQDLRLNKRLKDTPIAIVGMASLFAKSRYLNQFWDLICDKIDAITQVPADRWRVEDYFDANPKAADKSYCQRGGFIPELDFNPMEFGLPPNILELTDSSQLLSLIVAKEVLEDAGINENSGHDRDRIGITLGIGGGQKISQSLNARLQYPVLKKVFRESGISDEDSEMLIAKFQSQYIHWEENSFPGSLGNVIAGRIANRFDLGGMNCVVDAACAGSLAAIRMALTELTEGRSDMMLTGGVCTDNSAYMYMSFSKTPAFTPDEQIKPFDADSRGMMIGEGIGMVALKRLEDAERDGDKIYAVIKGVGASSDGKFKSIYAPRPEGQAKALKRAYDDAGFPPHTLGLMEAHGTGTAAGDVAEFAGLNSVMSENNDAKQHIALGSIKSQVGHTKSTAGTAGLIKAALALHHKVLPPTINVRRPNPKMDIENSPFYLNTEARPWLPRPDGVERRAAVSSFGFGGTNFHLVLEEYRRDHDRTPYRLRHTSQPLLICAASVAELQAELQSLVSVLKADKHGGLDALIAPYLLSGRELDPQWPRLGLLCQDETELQTNLEQALALLGSNSDAPWQQAGLSFRPRALLDDQGRSVALFAGQGSQYLNMGRELAMLYPEVRAEFAAADAAFAAQGEPAVNGMGALSGCVFPAPKFEAEAKASDEQRLTNTRIAQSAIGALAMGQFELLKAAGFKPDMVAGHSFGELAALHAAGAIDKAGFYALAFARGDAMAKVPEGKDPGAMAAVILPNAETIAKLETLLAGETEVSIANHNSPTQLVIAGATEALKRVSAALTSEGMRVIALPVSGAFHTPLVEHARQPFAAAIDKLSFSDAHTPLYANGSGDKVDGKGSKLKEGLKQQMLQQVQFVSQIESLYRDGARVFVEFGPKNTLTRLTEATLGERAAGCLILAVDTGVPALKAKDGDLAYKQAALALAMAGLPLGNPDPYQAPLAKPKQAPSPMNVRLGASNYISPATQAKMAAALSQGQVSKQTEIVEKIVEKTVTVPATAPAMKAQAQTETSAGQITQVAAQSPNQDSLGQFFAAQQQLAALHQQFLAIPTQYGNSIQTLLAQQLRLSAEGKAIPAGMEQALAQFHQHQADTLKIHADFMQAQSQSALQLLAGLSGQPLPAAVVHAAPAVTAPVQTLPAVVAPTTIAPAVAATKPQAAPMTPAAQPIMAASLTVQPQASSDNAAAGAHDVSQIMLQVVADKTGYPTEMLDLAMDMEADLGIDSIKRVEILGTVQDALPDLPELNPSDLAECRTLAEIVAYLAAKTPTQASAKAATQAVGQPVAQVQTQAQAQVQAQTQVQTQAPAMQSNISLDLVKDTMLAVVADKTGYPAEMLDLSMDMEADLGIDSIKRVEILGTVQDALPGLPELNPSDLAECRTLAEIVDYMAIKASGTLSVEPAAAQPVAVQTTQVTQQAQTDISLERVKDTMLSVVADKTGYPADMLDLAMDMEADLGIDSIKRVEILGTVQDALPGLPELNPSDLAECRTLAEIVDHMGAKASLSAQPAAVQPSAAPISQATQAAHTGISLELVKTTMLSVVADKTGYPAEMLDLAMDMEADLGIDSIKRVEILGTVQDALPEMAELNPADLAECRTLAEIIDCMAAEKAPIQAEPAPIEAAATPAVATAAVNSDAFELEAFEQLSSAPAISQADIMEALAATSMPAAAQVAAPVQGKSAAQATPTQADILTTLLTVVADKTGYPADMLDLAMDMEADLGIDSIKRVEILGTVQDALPGLPEVNPADLAECRALGQIADVYAKLLPAASPTATPAQAQAETEAEAKGQDQDAEAPALPPHGGVTLKKLPAADRLEAEAASTLFAANARVLILDDGHNAGVLAGKLARRQLQVTLVRPAAATAQSVQDSEIAAVQLASDDDAGIKTLLTGLDSAPAVFIHLQPVAEQKTEGLWLDESARARVQLAFLFAKHLSKPLTSANDGHRRAFISVARMDGKLGTDSGAETTAELEQAALFGLTKTLAHEWPGVHCRALDLHPALDAAHLADAVLDALYGLDDEPLEWGLCQEGRFTLQEGETIPASAPEIMSLDGTDKILVTGGAKGVTLDCALALAKDTGAHFILAGRSKALALSEFPAWAKGLAADELKAAAIKDMLAAGKRALPKEIDAQIQPLASALEIQAALQAFEAVGASAEYLSLDVTSAADIAAKLGPIQALAPITGLVHGAGVLADKLIGDKTLDELNRVQGTKVDGLKALLQVLSADSLKLVALFSSAAGFYGNSGQSDYAMANEILNKAAYSLGRQLPKARVVSFDWGPWDGGMVTAALKKMFVDRGVYVIPRQAGAALFARAIVAGQSPQLLIGSSMQGAGGEQALKKPEGPDSAITLNRKLSTQSLDLINDHRIGGNCVWPTVCALEWIASAAARIYGGQWQITDYKLLKGLVFDTDEKLLQLSLSPEGDTLNARIEADGKPQYRANLRPAGEMHAPVLNADLAKAAAEAKVLMSGEQLYADGSLFHGPALQLIEQVLSFDDGSLLCRYKLPQGQAPSALAQQDALLQAMLVWARLKYGAASLPSEFKTLFQGDLTTEGLIRLEVVSHSSRQLCANIALYDADGLAVSAMTEARVTISKGLNAAFVAAQQGEHQ
ncbi:type I polyketide synthase [Shewanella sedimentimangrovi]|uniref:Acyltransferase domain-containing protein n=1 Tax=Shewanella sedimentimangrovi TaxID=2814293 RepID=A0ABX7R371_9GAMM|nr:type I polyketide synthase [Shewanella sedimentimangrovi]QSX38279.1 acyltransferase domain-containing protein [Shewanella sedimentimangrovi]